MTDSPRSIALCPMQLSVNDLPSPDEPISKRFGVLKYGISSAYFFEYSKSMSIANKKHDLAAIQVYDRRDSEMPDVGLIRLNDLETGDDIWVDTSSKKVRKMYAKDWYERQQKISAISIKCNVDLISVSTNDDYVKVLLGLFRRRAMSR